MAGKYISNGVHSNTSKKTLNAIKRARSGAEIELNKQRAWEQGKNPWMTVVNPNKNETNKKFIRVKANDLMGNPKEVAKKMFMMPGA